MKEHLCYVYFVTFALYTTWERVFFPPLIQQYVSSVIICLLIVINELYLYLYLLIALTQDNIVYFLEEMLISDK